MAYSLSKQTAQKIVDTVKDVCGHDINFINRDGIIFASTNSKRIGDFHEIGKQVVVTQKTLEVQSDDTFLGTQKGVNIPFIYNHESIAAIGISGEPDQVRQFAILAEKITALILREQDMDSQRYDRKSQTNYILHSLINGDSINHDFLTDFLTKSKLPDTEKYRIVVVKLSSRYNISNLSLIEDHLFHAFKQIPESIYTFNYPNEYILMISENMYERWDYILFSLAKNYEHILHIGIGNICSIGQQYLSYDSAKIALNSLTTFDNIALFDNLDLQILLGCITKEAQSQYLSKTIRTLGQNDLNMLSIYFDLNMSLKDTAEKLYLHVNTLQYQLNRIHRITGYNPRTFKDAVILYVALRLV